MRTSTNVWVLFSTLFLIIYSYMCWFIGLHFTWYYLRGFAAPLLPAFLMAGLAATAYFLGIRRTSSRHSPILVALFAPVLFFIFASSNHWFLPGLWPALLVMAIVAFAFGLTGKAAAPVEPS